MTRWATICGFAVCAWLGGAGVALAGLAPTPAPVLGAGPVGIGILAVAGAGYLGVRFVRRRRR
jgi:hypothetical protein